MLRFGKQCEVAVPAVSIDFVACSAGVRPVSLAIPWPSFSKSSQARPGSVVNLALIAFRGVGQFLSRLREKAKHVEKIGRQTIEHASSLPLPLRGRGEQRRKSKRPLRACLRRGCATINESSISGLSVASNKQIMQSPPDSPEDKLRGRIKHARFGMWVSIALLMVSLAAVIACMRVEWATVVPFLMWNHIAILIVFGMALFTWRRISDSSGRGFPRLRELFAPWVVGLALISAALAIPDWGAPTGKAAVTPEGTIISSHHWRRSPDGTRYFETFNRGPEREITRVEYEELARGSYSFFARAWVLFSFLSLVMWRTIALRCEAMLIPPITEPGPASRPASSMAAEPEAGAGWKSTAAIFTIWIFTIASSLLGSMQLPSGSRCSPIFPDAMRFVVVLMPPVIFAGAALFINSSPFVSPWVANCINEKLGAGEYERFIERLKPLLLFSATGFIGAVKLVFECGQAGASPVDWTMPGFFASGGLSFALLHGILRWRRIPGI